jgi:RNA recognition motif-containing protein
MGRRLYVGNLPYKTTEEELSTLFSKAGAVENAQVMRDTMTGRARGFGFVEMATEDGAQKAIAEFHQYQLDGRALVVNEARPKTPGGGGRGFAGNGAGAFSETGGDHNAGRRREPRW